MNNKKERIIVYNDILFLRSQTFMYEQVKVLAGHYKIHLWAKRFVNPHSFNVGEFDKIKIDQPAGLADKVASRLARNYYNTSLYFNTRTIRQLRKFLKNNKVKAIHAHFGPRALEVLGIAKKHNIPLVVTFHGYDASSLLRDKEYVKKLPALFEYASKIILVSEHMIEALKLEAWKAKVHIIPCSVDEAEFTNLARNHTGSNKIKILHAGRIVGKKGVPDLVRVFNGLEKNYPDIELHIAGDGDQLEMCRQMVSEYSIEDKVIFYGGVSHAKIKELLSEADIFVLNSRVDDKGDMEGTPVTILEAMCMEKAVVSTRHAGIPYVIDHGKNGLLANEKDNEELEAHLRKLIEDKQLRKKLGSSAKKTINQSFSSKVMGDKLKSVFSDI